MDTFFTAIVLLIMFQRVWVPVVVFLVTAFIFFVIYPAWRLLGLTRRGVRYCLWRFASERLYKLIFQKRVGRTLRHFEH